MRTSSGMSHIQFGSKPKLVDDECIDDFCNRRVELLAKAAMGQLTYPTHLPIE